MNKSFKEFLIVVGIFAFVTFIAQLNYKYIYKHWWLEDKFRVVQIVREKNFYEDRYQMYEIGMNFKKMDSIEKDNMRPKPYALETIYKGVVTTDYGDIKYLKGIKCKRYNDAIAKYERQVLREALADSIQEVKEKELEKLIDLDCD